MYIADIVVRAIACANSTIPQERRGKGGGEKARTVARRDASTGHSCPPLRVPPPSSRKVHRHRHASLCIDPPFIRSHIYFSVHRSKLGSIRVLRENVRGGKREKNEKIRFESFPSRGNRINFAWIYRGTGNDGEEEGTYTGV